jgi:TMEM175 potassium channel family protein
MDASRSPGNEEERGTAMAEGPKPVQTYGTARLEAFSDGVYAIAITLLILEIKVPPLARIEAAGLWRTLAGQWPSFVAYALSFAIIGIMWSNHHNVFRFIARTDQTLILLNSGLMFCTAFLPFPTAVLADCLPSPSARQQATVFYGLTLTVTAIFYNGLWRYAVTKRRLVAPETDQAHLDAITREFRWGPVVYAAATAVAFLSPAVSLSLHGLAAIVYAIPRRSRP